MVGGEPTAPFPLPHDLFNEYRPERATEDYTGVTDAFNKLMANIPRERKIAFAYTYVVPFRAIFPSGHETKPGVASTYPGEELPAITAWTFDLCPIDIEIKGSVETDPFDDHLCPHMPSAKHNDKTLAQVAKNGRNIPAENCAFFCFAVGVYGDTARIYRPDRTCLVISPIPRLKATEIVFQNSRRTVRPLRVALLNFSIPPSPNLLGLDTTITTLTAEDKIWLRDILIGKHQYSPELTEARVIGSKKMLAMYRPLTTEKIAGLNNSASLKWCYTIGKPLSHSSGLFS
ncbi:hypothetical protein AX15_007560 [Amanita polypyramis BW_CC]|nr:hypothetical protein AX15_007560 [Amanita polypyramis BW_CC]